jgi:glycosyltransferase involved in cell wall biosynthesis
MVQNYNFTYIIGYRHKADRLFLLRRTLDWINSFTGAQVILVEQDTHSKISHINLNAKHIFTKSNMPYNRSWAFNVGIKYANTNIIIFGDSDIIMHPNDFINAIKEINNYDMVSPYHSVVDLTSGENGLSLSDIVKIDRPGRGETDNQKINICGGISIFRRDAILKIGGWDEDFWSWGGEDDLQTIKVNYFLTWHEMKARCFHLYHDKEQPIMNFYKRSLEILHNARQMSKEDIQRVINNTMQRIGLINKCENY